MRIFQTVRLSPFAGTLHWTWLNRWILSDIDVFPALNYLLKLRLILGEIFIPSGNVFNLAPMMPIDARVKHSSSLYLLEIVTDRLVFYAPLTCLVVVDMAGNITLSPGLFS